MPWAVAATAAATIGGALISSNSAEDAADTQAGATAAQIAEQRRQYDLTRGDYSKYRKEGNWALGQLHNGLGKMPTSREVMRDPGYQFGLEQGQLGLDRKAAASGGRVSGASLKAASEYATNYATTGYNAAYQRRQDRLSRLQSLAGLGQSATSGTSAAGMNATNAIGNAIGSQGDAAAAGQLANGNIWGGAINQIGAIGSRWASAPSSQGSAVSNGSLFGANMSSDPIGSLGGSQGWW